MTRKDDFLYSYQVVHVYCMRVFNPLEMQWLYRARKSTDVEAEEIAVAAGNDGLRRGPLWTTSAQEGKLDLIPVLF